MSAIEISDLRTNLMSFSSETQHCQQTLSACLTRLLGRSGTTDSYSSLVIERQKTLAAVRTVSVVGLQSL